MIKSKSLRPFIGCSNFAVSSAFYMALGFEETKLGDRMSVFSRDHIAFYLQDCYIEDWVNNTMLFWEVAALESVHDEVLSLNLMERFPQVRISDIVNNDWGSEFFLHDPDGILWHIGCFK